MIALIVMLVILLVVALAVWVHCRHQGKQFVNFGPGDVQRTGVLVQNPALFGVPNRAFSPQGPTSAVDGGGRGPYDTVDAEPPGPGPEGSYGEPISAAAVPPNRIGVPVDRTAPGQYSLLDLEARYGRSEVGRVCRH